MRYCQFASEKDGTIVMLCGKVDSSMWDFYIKDSKGSRKVIVEFTYNETVISEGWEIHYPVDQAHQEPPEIEEAVDIDSVERYVGVDKWDDTMEADSLSDIEKNLIEELIVNNQ